MLVAVGSVLLIWPITVLMHESASELYLKIRPCGGQGRVHLPCRPLLDPGSQRTAPTGSKRLMGARTARSAARRSHSGPASNLRSNKPSPAASCTIRTKEPFNNRGQRPKYACAHRRGTNAKRSLSPSQSWPSGTQIAAESECRRASSGGGGANQCISSRL